MGNLLHSGLHPGLDGRAPKTIAPTLFSKAKRKNITVQKALLDNRWIAHILPILTLQELNEYVTLWQAVSHTMLIENREDTVYWCWTSDGEYTTKHLQYSVSRGFQ